MNEESRLLPTRVLPAPPGGAAGDPLRKPPNGSASAPSTRTNRIGAVRARPPDSSPPSDDTPVDSVRLPPVGTHFLGFRLIAVIGKGAFGQVYLAEEDDLAHRYVTVKIARESFGESQMLAQLQHTHIVPIYSIHRADAFQVVCMPYFGATTLADMVGERTGQPTSGQVFGDVIAARRRSLPALRIGEPTVPDSAALLQLARMSYVDAVLWIAERLVDGLAHAHERGILHHDLKPANILLTDAGVPMLLDFNISEDTKGNTGVAANMAGGTLPYMSPEHLARTHDRDISVDARSDIYSLGIILYELLAGKRPFNTPSELAYDRISEWIAERHQPLPPLRAANPDVSPAVASIVSHCLEADPARRYRTARELQEDLRRQRSHLPLRYAGEPSIGERARKWVRRHPRLTSTTSVALLLGVILGTASVAFAARGQQLARLQAEESLRQFQGDVRTAQFLLYSRHADHRQLDEGMTHCRSALRRFEILDNPNWQQLSAARHLREADRTRLRDEAGEVLFLLARAAALRAQAQPGPVQRDAGLDEAVRCNQLAEACFGAELVPRAVWEQRADLAKLRGDAREAAEFAQKASTIPLRTPRDRYLIAHQHAIRGQSRQALNILQQVTQEDPTNFSAWFVRGNCSYDLLQDADAVACFNVCVTLRPEFHWSWFNRGLAHLRLRQFQQALADFDQVLQRKPDLADGHVCRGLAHEGMHAYGEAVADYTNAFDCPGASTRIWFLRSAAKAKAADANGAQRDYNAGLATEPTDEFGWIARGSARRDRDPKGSLADYDQALKVNPRSFDALQNKAALLSDKFGKDGEALAVLERGVEIYPESVLARGGRGVLLARIGQRKVAVEDAQACLLLDSSPATLYQVGCIYALTSKQTPADRTQAMPLLAAALRAGFGLEFVDHDSDLDPLRNLPEFQRMVTAARALHPAAPKR